MMPEMVTIKTAGEVNLFAFIRIMYSLVSNRRGVGIVGGVGKISKINSRGGGVGIIGGVGKNLRN